MDKIAGLMMALTIAAAVASGIMMFLTPTKERGPIDVSPRG